MELTFVYFWYLLLVLTWPVPRYSRITNPALAVPTPSHNRLPAALLNNNFSNKTLYGIPNDGVRYLWTSYYVFVVLSSLIGDSTILLASIKYRAFRLHEFITVVIQHIAVCDILVATNNVIPIMVSLMSDDWVLGVTWCYFTPYPVYCANSASIMLICAMTTSRLLLLRAPHKQRSFTAEKAHVMCLCIWVVSLGLPIMFLIVDNNDVMFDQRIFLCDYAFNSATWRWLLPLMTSILIYLPTFMTALSTVPLVLYLCKARRVARRSGGTRRWQGILLSVLTASIYSFSVLPYAVYRFAQSSFEPDSFFHTIYFRVAVSFLSFNTISNFYIYSLTVPSFRRFLWSKISWENRSYVVVPNTGTNNGNNP